jgi:hypothetical protein
MIPSNSSGEGGGPSPCGWRKRNMNFGWDSVAEEEEEALMMGKAGLLLSSI